MAAAQRLRRGRRASLLASPIRTRSLASTPPTLSSPTQDASSLRDSTARNKRMRPARRSTARPAASLGFATHRRQPVWLGRHAPCSPRPSCVLPEYQQAARRPRTATDIPGLMLRAANSSAGTARRHKTGYPRPGKHVSRRPRASLLYARVGWLAVASRHGRGPRPPCRGCSPQ